MFPVHRPVHPHGGLQMVQPAVDADAVGERCQGGSTETGGARGDGVADQTHHTGVDVVPLQTQFSENILSVFQTAVLPERQTQTGSEDKRQRGCFSEETKC